MISVGDVQMGLEVYDANGEEIGRVNEIVNDPYPGGGQEHLFMQVAEGDIVEIWKPNLYIPFSAITGAEAGQWVKIDCTKSEAEGKYGKKPDFLG